MEIANMSRFNRQQTFVYVSECGAELRESATQETTNLLVIKTLSLLILINEKLTVCCRN